MAYEQYRPNSFRSLPLVVKNLLILNVLVYLVSQIESYFFNINLTDILGLHFPLSEKFHLYQLITCMFMHDQTSLFHILFNMFALLMFGKILESVWGPKRFLFFYIVTGIGAGLLHSTVSYYENKPAIDFINSYIQNPDLNDFNVFLGQFKPNSMDLVNHYNAVIPTAFNNALSNNNIPEALKISVDYMQTYKIDFPNSLPPAIGASGAIFGILVAFGMLFPNTELYLMFIPIPIKAKYAVILYGVIELFMGVARFSWDNIAHFAHLGGALFGFILVKYWQKGGKNFY